MVLYLYATLYISILFITDSENLSAQAERHREEVQSLLQTFLKGKMFKNNLLIGYMIYKLKKS